MIHLRPPLLLQKVLLVASFNLEILKIHLKNEKMEGIDISDLARRTSNYSGSDLKNLAVSAALTSLKEVIPDVWNAHDGKKKVGNKANSDKDTEAEAEAEAEGSDATSDSGSDDDDDEPIVAPRILRPVHFHAAFEQVSATSSRDMSSVQKLRTWAAQFSRDSGLGYTAPFRASPPPALSKGYAHLGIPSIPKATLAPKGISADVVGPGTSTPAAPPTNNDGGILWDDEFEANILSRFSSLSGIGDSDEAPGTNDNGTGW